MTAAQDSRVAFRQFRKARGGARKAAEELHVTHAAVLSWEKGRSVPSQPYREAIERWSGGTILASGWKLNRRERELIRAAGKVSAAESGEHPVVDAESTGTDPSS